MAVTAKRVLQKVAARKALMVGVRTMAEVVGSVLGPISYNASMKGQYTNTITVHDGVTISREIKLPDLAEDIGADMLREAAEKTNDNSGDGTTTSIVLGGEIAQQGEAYLIAGSNPFRLVKGINHAVNQAVSLLEAMAEPVKGDVNKMIQVASVSAADDEIGKTVAEAFKKVGPYGIVTVEKGSEVGYHTEYKDGMEWDMGWNIVYYITDAVRREALLTNPYIFVTDRSIATEQEIRQILLPIAKQESADKVLVIISDGMQDRAQQAMIMQLVTIMRPDGTRGQWQLLGVGAPSLGAHKRDGLEDIAIMTGAKFISQEQGLALKDLKIEDFGRADQVVSTEKTTVIVGGKGDVEKIKARAAQIEEQIKTEDHEQLKEKLQERLAKLTAGVAVIKVGTNSDTENREKLERVRDAIGATKAAAEGGIIPGGGLALLRISEQIDTNLADREESFGAEIVKKALARPMKLLAENAGVNGDVVANEVLNHQQDTGVGYDVVSGEYVNMKEAGIIDPVRVTISALQNAASVAAMILTTNSTITDLMEEKAKKE